MSFRHKLQYALLMILTFFAFASYHQGTGSTLWLQYTTLAIFVVFSLVFDLAFTNESSFIFDPDADNWRRKTEAGM
eukprot:CAMPEP_0194375606 /NCGR_PEP_ID=MMETSP0174-20130528/24150_1 /TAXON_ID=216777 /ORGANISM="Proboscia alata, Strain PI-D3" /LENGTH=75 /DNA_ID=CAMNT_0039155927 /DNA_START=67 /DNA_END=294 /DNA_ORIENTATION=-